MNRFSKQINLSELGEAGQKKLLDASVLCVGAGGLGCPALLYLASAGVGRIGILDGDVVDESNLNRQVIFGRADIGKSKAEVAARILLEKYGDFKCIPMPFFLRNDNAVEILEDWDLVLDCTDNFATRYLINDACVLLGKPFVQGAIFRDEGQVAVFNHRRGKSRPCNYRDLYPNPPAAVPNCDETGVLGVLPGVIGTLQASEAIKLITGRGVPLADELLFINLYTNTTYKLDIEPNPIAEAALPKSREVIENRDYGISCSADNALSWEVAKELLQSDRSGSVLVDVREEGEQPVINLPSHVKLPLKELKNKVGFLREYDRVLFFCRSGRRSMEAIAEVKSEINGRLYSIEGGLLHPDSPVKKSESWKNL